MRVVGFSLVANAVRLDFPIREAIQSILPLCDEVVVNVGPSDDNTLDLVRSVADPRLRIIEGRWDRSHGGAVLALETQRALDACRGDWAIYIQADEVLHESGQQRLSAAMAAAQDDPRVEGLLVDFLHFYGNTDWVGRGRGWYRREVRVVRPGGQARSFEEAQGFRIGPRLRKVRVRTSGATYYHYGWARPLPALRAKREADNRLYYRGEPRRSAVPERMPWEVGLERFAGSHPGPMAPWIAARRAGMSDGFAPRRWSTRRAAMFASLLVERAIGWRPFEFTNYVEI
ncbi:MAG TPA: glycosyltransferase [Gemmatimonadales bacterium]|nr:glycosyltransferase [Gemmatimonadales bacterium]